MVLLEDHLSEFFAEAHHFGLKQGKVESSFLLLLVKHGAHLKNLVA